MTSNYLTINYPSNRKQFTEVNVYKSNTQMIQAGAATRLFSWEHCYFYCISMIYLHLAIIPYIVILKTVTIAKTPLIINYEGYINGWLLISNHWIIKIPNVWYSTPLRKIEYPDLNINCIAIKIINHFFYRLIYKP